MPKTLDRFTLGDPLSTSEVATVYHATEVLPTGPTRPVLLKVFSAVSGEDRAGEFRYAAELRTYAIVGEAPHVASLYAAGIAESRVGWLAIAPAVQTIESQISDNPGDPAVIARLLDEATQGLSAIHARNLLHNDVKPANLLITQAQGCIISDLSLAAPPTAEITQQSDMVRFAAPEVFSREFGKLAPSTDLYSLGHVAYEMALGTRQWRAQFPQVFDPGMRSRDTINPAKWMAWHCSTQNRAAKVHELQQSFPAALSEIIARLIAKDPAQRFGSAQDVLHAVREAQANRPIATTGNPPPAAGSGVRSAISVPAAAAPAAAGPHAAATAPPARSGSPSAPAQAPQPVQSGPLYFVRLRNRQTGPFDFAMLQRHVRSGLISRLHQVSTDGQTWRPATSLDGLFGI